MYGLARLRARDPCDAAGALCDLAVERKRGFQCDEWQARTDPFGEGLVDALCGLVISNLDFNAGTPEFAEAAAGDSGIRILHCSDDARDARVDNGFRARPGTAGGAARLESYVESRAARFFARLLECDDFSVVALVVFVESFAEFLMGLGNDRAYVRIGVSEPDAATRELEGALQKGSVCWLRLRRHRSD